MSSSASGHFVHPTACVDQPVSIGAGTKIWHFCHVCSGAVIGSNCVIGQNCFISATAKIGDGCKIQNNVSIYDGVELADDVFCGPSMVFTNVINPRSAVNRKSEFKKTLVRTGTTIGANATLLCGITLGEYCFIAAGAVVTKDVPAYGLITGVPGQLTGWMSRHGHRLAFDASGLAVCTASGQKYRRINDSTIVAV